ncbi:sigma factor-like helix-turn-helix DNA-binding protein [Streptomyces sp. NPDC049916]|uniref:sigma factor-like helix-turn-helix DNA-binding protein n=1 Tax=Streptomyces sp. NPDC049916 TaxID=3155156 RepID=UPI003441A549
MHSGRGLFAALSKLPARQFDVVVLRYVAQYDTKRISWYLGITDSTVASIRARVSTVPSFFIAVSMNFSSSSTIAWVFQCRSSASFRSSRPLAIIMSTSRSRPTLDAHTAPHRPRHARIAFSDSGAKQLDSSEAELHSVDRALIVVSVDSDDAELLPGNSTGPQLRQYVDDVERVRLVYWVTALETIVVVAFLQV